MPSDIDPATIAAITDGINQISNTAQVAQTSKKQRKFIVEQYNRQRADALADWDKQNAYNTPASQMQRLKEAGLNPNLVYGNGADATSNSMPRSTDSGNWKPEVYTVPHGSAMNSLQQFYNTEVQQAQIDNLAVQKTLTEQQAIHEAQKTLGTIAGTQKTTAETNTLNTMRSTNLEAARVSIEKMLTDITSSTDSNKRANQMQPYNLKTASANLQAIAADIANKRASTAKTEEERVKVKAEVNNLLRTGMLQDLEYEIRQRGGNPQDAYWEKKAQQIIEKIIEKGGKIADYLNMLERENN